MSLEAIRYKRGELSILDQLLLPTTSQYEPVKNVQDGWRVIREMKVNKLASCKQYLNFLCKNIKVR